MRPLFRPNFGGQDSGVAGWGAWILARILTPDPGPPFQARLQTSRPADPSASPRPGRPREIY
jgi:hypothetical protein